MASETVGLSRRMLEDAVRWKMHRAPREDPTKMADFLVDLVMDLIEINNAAIAASLEEQTRTDLPEGG